MYFDLLNSPMILVLQKTPWNPGLLTIFHELNMYLANIYIFIIIYIYKCVCVCVAMHDLEKVAGDTDVLKDDTVYIIASENSDTWSQKNTTHIIIGVQITAGLFSKRGRREFLF